MELKGYVKLYRKLRSWGWYSDCVVKDLFLHCLLSANYNEVEWMGCNLDPGQFVTTVKELSGELGFSDRQIRTALSKLESTGEIERKSTNKFTVITVVKWGDFQVDFEQSDKRATNERQTKDKQTTNKTAIHIKKEDKEYKENKEESARPRARTRAYGKYANVMLTEEQYRSIRKDVRNAVSVIDRLSSYMKTHGKTYADHEAVIREWADEDTPEGANYDISEAEKEMYSTI